MAINRTLHFKANKSKLTSRGLFTLSQKKIHWVALKPPKPFKSIHTSLFPRISEHGNPGLNVPSHAAKSKAFDLMNAWWLLPERIWIGITDNLQQKIPKKLVNKKFFLHSTANINIDRQRNNAPFSFNRPKLLLKQVVSGFLTGCFLVFQNC